MAYLTIAQALESAAAERESGRGAAIAVVIDDRSGNSWPAGSRLVVAGSGSLVGSLSPEVDEVLLADALVLLHERRSRLHSYLVEAGSTVRVSHGQGNLEVFFEVVHPPPQLIVVGAGHIALPLVRIASILDFEATVIDDRDDFASRERFPDASDILVGRYRDTVASLAVDSHTYVVLVTRGHVHDQACLELVLESPAAYIGMIGSKRRVRTVMQRLAEKGFSAAALDRVFAPVGLDIGSQTPAEIALAIMAEIVNVRRGGRARSLASRAAVRD